MGYAAVAQWVALALGAHQARTGYESAQEQDQLAAQGIRTQAQRQREADALVNQTVNRVQTSNPEAERQSSLEQYLGQLQKTQGTATAGFLQPGAVSSRYTQGVADAKTGIKDYSTNVADIFSRIDAPNRQRQREGISFGRLGSDIGRIQSQSDTDRYLTDLRIQRSRRGNPWLDALAETASQYGRSSGGGG